MTTLTVPTVTAMQAQAQANAYLLAQVPDRLTAGLPQFDEGQQNWRIPVILTYPLIGTLGTVGEIIIDPVEETVLTATPTDEMLAEAKQLAEANRDALEAAFS